MNYELKRFSSDDWELVSEEAHSVLFGGTRPKSLNRHHFILAVLADGELGGYITCLEMDSETVYIQYGGVFPIFQKTIHAMAGYNKLIAWTSEHYKRASTKIENTNTAMLKMAMQLGFVITGTHYFDGKLFVDLLNEFKGGR